jgi:catechol 2,3-dioxygenase-like lactoylglutathione lyase family enzyme
MLASAQLVAFVPTCNPPAAREFYEHACGLKFIADDGFALVFDANGTTLRIVNVSSCFGFTPAPFTILGWHVPNVEHAAAELTKAGIKFERFPGLDQNASGIWRSPNGTQVAWFKDPDGNVLSISGA